MYSGADHAFEVRHGTIRHSRIQNDWRLRHPRCPPSIRRRKTGGSVKDSRPPPRFHAERFLEAERATAVVIIVAMPAKQPVARLFVARNGPAVLFMDFEPHGAPPAAARCGFR